jgi:hypothetical protein
MTEIGKGNTAKAARGLRKCFIAEKAEAEKAEARKV